MTKVPNALPSIAGMPFKTEDGKMVKPITTLPIRVGANWCQCSTCKFVFSNVRGFDRHRRNGQCVDPASVGLAVNSRGMWTRPAPALNASGVVVETAIPPDPGKDKAPAAGSHNGAMIGQIEGYRTTSFAQTREKVEVAQ